MSVFRGRHAGVTDSSDSSYLIGSFLSIIRVFVVAWAKVKRNDEMISIFPFCLFDLEIEKTIFCELLIQLRKQCR